MNAKTMTYEKAVKRLEQIVSQVENNELNIDQLGASLKEAQELLAFCKERLYKADAEINKMLDDFQKEA